MIDSSDRRKGVAERNPEGSEGPFATRDAFRELLDQAAEMIGAQPSPNSMRAKARRIANAVIHTGDTLAEQAANQSKGA